LTSIMVSGISISRFNENAEASNSEISLIGLDDWCTQFYSLVDRSSIGVKQSDVHNHFLYFDGTPLEWSATPMGVGMMPGDHFSILHNDLLNQTLDQSIRDTLDIRRLNEEISFGINLTMEYFVQVIQITDGEVNEGEDCSKTCSSLLRSINDVLLEAFEITKRDMPAESLPRHQPNFELVTVKLDQGLYQHAKTCLKDIADILKSYGKSGVSLIQNEDEDLKIEGATMLFLKKEMEQSLREFWTFMQTYAIEQEEQEEENEAIDEESEVEQIIIVGPIRDFSGEGTLEEEPSIFLYGMDDNTTVDDLIFSYCIYTKLDNADDRLEFTSLNLAQYCSEDHEHQLGCLMEPFFRFQKNNDLQQHFHLALQRVSRNGGVHIEDGRNVDDLVDFIEGDYDGPRRDHRLAHTFRPQQPDGDLNISLPYHLDEDPEDYASDDESDDWTDWSGSDDDSSDDESAEDVDSGISDEPVDNTTAPLDDGSLDDDGSSGEGDSVLEDTDHSSGMESDDESDETDSDDDSESEPEPQQPKASSPPMEIIVDSTSTSDETTLELEALREKSLKRLSRARERLLAKLVELEKEMTGTEQEHAALSKQNCDRLANLVQTLENSEDKLHAGQGEATQLDAEIQLLRDEIARIQSQKEKLKVENDNLEREMKKLRKKRIAAEGDLEKKIAPLKEKKGNLIKEIQGLREKILQNATEVEAASRKPESGDAGSKNLLLDFLTNQIKSKEDDLECPVCLETSATPIYMCQNQHIICSDCLEKIQQTVSKKECVQCRTPYPKKPERHRYMEKVADELQTLRSKRRDIIQAKTA